MPAETRRSRHLVAYRDGESVFRQGEAGDQMYIVQEGRVEIVLEGAEGEVTLATLERGDFFGEMAVLEGGPRTATARAKGPCKVLPLRGTLFVEMLQRDPETTLRIMRKLCSRIRELEQRTRGQLEPRDAAASVTAPPAARLRSARLVHASGLVLQLPEVPEARVGRPDPAVGTVPEIDLTALNKEATVSRAHARILQRDGRLLLLAEAGATNGTYVGGERLEPAVPRELRAGDRIGFGSVTLELQID